jgi:hypothetical protein
MTKARNPGSDSEIGKKRRSFSAWAIKAAGEPSSHQRLR